MGGRVRPLTNPKGRWFARLHMKMGACQTSILIIDSEVEPSQSTREIELLVNGRRVPPKAARKGGTL